MGRDSCLISTQGSGVGSTDELYTVQRFRNIVDPASRYEGKPLKDTVELLQSNGTTRSQRE